MVVYMFKKRDINSLVAKAQALTDQQKFLRTNVCWVHVSQQILSPVNDWKEFERIDQKMFVCYYNIY